MKRFVAMLFLVAVLFTYTGNAMASINDLDNELARVFYRDIVQGGIMYSFRELTIQNGHTATEVDRAIAQAVSQARKDGLNFYIDPKLGGTPELGDNSISQVVIAGMIVLASCGIIVARKKRHKLCA